MTYGLNSFQAASASRDKILYHHHALSGRKIAFYQIFQTVIFGRRAHIYIWKPQRVGHKSTHCNGACCDTGYSIGLFEILEDEPAHLYLDEAAYLRIG